MTPYLDSWIPVQRSSLTKPASPIHTYQRRGRNKPIDPFRHASILTVGTDAPIVDGLIHTVFQVEPAKPHLTLDTRSLLNFGKVHTVDYRDRVKSLGRLTPESVENLLLVWSRLNGVDNLTDIDASMAY
jgi:hypothetical protein